MLLLSKIDVLGTPATLNFFGDKKKTSSFGGICSLVFFSFIVWSIYNSSYDLLSRINPTTSKGIVNIEEPRLINISIETFPVAFIVQTPTTLQATGFTDETIYTIELEHKRLDRVEQPNGTYAKVWTYTYLKTEKCTKEYFGEYASSFSSFTFQGSHCISQNQTGLDKLYLQGTNSSPIYQALTARVKVCSNDTSNVTNITCASPAKIKQHLSGSYFSAMYLDNIIDMQNFTNPMGKFRELYYTLMNPLSYKTLDIEVGYVELTSDAGWFTESMTTMDSLKVNKVSELIDLNPSLDNTLIACTFKASRTETFYTRTYKKIPTILAEVGGLANTALAILLIVTTPYLRLKSREALMNGLFVIKTPKKSLDAKKKSPKSDEKKKKVSNKARKSNESKTDYFRQNSQKVPNIVTTLTTEAAPFQTQLNSARGTQDPPDSQRVQLIMPPSDQLEKNPTFTFNEPGSQRDSSRHTIPAFASDPENLLGSPQITRENTIPFPQEISTPTRLFSHRNKPTMARGDTAGKNVVLSEDDYENDIEIQLESIKEKIIEEGEDLEGDYEIKPAIINEPTSDKVVNKIRGANEEGEEEEEEKDEVRDQSQGEERKEHEKYKWLIELKRKISRRNTELQMWEYLLSFIWKPKSLKEKFEILEQGAKSIDQRLDLSNLLKKFREVDKLIALLLDSDQLELFNSIPNPEIRAQERFELSRKSSFERNLQRMTLMGGPKSKKQMMQCYNRLKFKENKNEIDRKLIEVFCENEI